MRSKLRIELKPVVLLGISVLLAGITQLPLSPTYLSLDNVNLAFALEQFDPWMHQPHPPGYPFFVAEARMANFIFQDPRTTFIAISVAVSALSLLLIAAIGERIFSPWAGLAAALLLLVNPTFWFSALESPLRPHLALFSLLVAYCCWRSWIDGEHRYVLWGALALGIGSGFRPDLIFYLLPLWVVSAWLGSRQISLMIRGIGIIFGVVVIWIGILGWAVGGLDRLNLLLMTYLAGQFSVTSILMGIGANDWLFQLCRLIAWNGIGVLSWLFAIPLWLYGRQQHTNQKQRLAFILAWVGPGLAAQALFHAAAPGHTLFSVPALCLLGGSVLSISVRKVSSISRLQPVVRLLALLLAVGINLFLFLNSFQIAMRVAAMDTGGFGPAQRGFADAVFQASPDNLRQADDFTAASIQEIQRLTGPDQCVVIVASLGSAENFRFLNSRIASYYFPDQYIWILADEESSPRVTLIQGMNLLDIRYGTSINISIPRNSRVVWLTDSNGPLRTALSSQASGNASIFHTDFSGRSSPLHVSAFRFLPDQPACSPRLAQRPGGLRSEPR